VSHPRVRFTVRRLMLAVLIVAVLLTAFEAGRRWERTKRAAQLSNRLHISVYPSSVKGSLEFRSTATR
jgi:hypothetical protein